jgi:hypothetical protein
MRKFARILACLVFAALAIGCQPAEDSKNLDQVLQGKISGQAFAFVSGCAIVNASDAEKWDITLYCVEPAAGTNPWDSGAYSVSAKTVTFTVPMSVSDYSVTTIGSAPAISVIGCNGGFSYVAFDSGSLSIDAIDTTVGIISGTVSIITTDKNSQLDGKFTVKYDTVL